MHVTLLETSIPQLAKAIAKHVEGGETPPPRAVREVNLSETTDPCIARSLANVMSVPQYDL